MKKDHRINPQLSKELRRYFRKITGKDETASKMLWNTISLFQKFYGKDFLKWEYQRPIQNFRKVKNENISFR